MMKVKICGIMDQKTALEAAEMGADALGFVFADSKRKITPEAAREITRQLPEKIMKIGVFVNETKAEIERIASYVGLTHIQLHGTESPEFCQSLSYPVIKAISIEKKEDIEYAEQFTCNYILFDGPKGKYHGGNGISFNWQLAGQLRNNANKLILAGGLNVKNVSEAIKLADPFMVDVSSGVESNGKKDLLKIKRFIEMAKSYEEEKVK